MRRSQEAGWRGGFEPFGVLSTMPLEDFIGPKSLSTRSAASGATPKRRAFGSRRLVGTAPKRQEDGFAVGNDSSRPRRALVRQLACCNKAQ